jgi:hypothetical protein
MTALPQVYGDTKAFKRTLDRYIHSGGALLDQARGVNEFKKKVETETAASPNIRPYLVKLIAETDWLEQVERWRFNANRVMRRHLLSQLQDILPTVSAPIPPEDGKPRHARNVEVMEPWLREAVGELVALRETLGIARNVSVTAPPVSRFVELESSGLIEPVVLKQFVKQMSTLNTPARRHYAIGAAKEITEATLRAALDRLQQPWQPGDDLGTLAKRWRLAVDALAPPDPLGADALKKALASLAGVITFLTEWRNKYGSGHGRPKYAPTSSRQARLAVDAAETVVRYISLTMDDLELLPPLPE